jgi:alpha-1,6-mannosyltransferase
MPQEHPTSTRWRVGFSALLLLAGIAGLGFLVEQSNFPLIASFFGLAFIGYFILLREEDPYWIKRLVWLGIGLRFLLLFALPALSDDLYRFIWDGRLLTQGINPFNHLPGHYLQAGNEIEGLSQQLYEQLNSPEYFTIYPPIAQFTYALACLLFPASIFGSAFVMKAFLFAFEIGSIFLLIRLLRHLQLPTGHVLIYALNPLIIVELSGNLHFEAGMVFFLLLAVWLYFRQKNHWAGVSLASSIASKLLPLMFLPFLIKKLGWRKSFFHFILIGLVLLLLFSPLINGVFLSHLSESVDLYFRKFEFNASVYYLIRWVGFQLAGFNIIQWLGPILGLITLSGILLLAFRERNPKREKLPAQMLFAFCLYLLLSTTVHPWYLSIPIALCGLTRFRFPLVWSALIPLTYINYSYPEYFENLWIVAVEYLAVAAYFIYEIRFKKAINTL